MLRRRLLPLAALALAVPVPALALTGGDEGGAPATALSVTASLDTCGVAEGIVCKIDAGWGSVEGADYYTASVTRSDGSVVDYGQVGAGSGTSLWVPYVGSGTYTVQISAYGTPPGEDEPELVAKDTAAAGGESGEGESPGPAPEGEVVEEGDGDGDLPADGGGAVEEPPAKEPPPCEPTEPDPPAESTEPDTGADAVEQSAADLGKLPDAATAALQAEAELPESVDCPAPAE